MKSFIAALRNLVLPFGATSGQRIILDSTTGKISLYGSDNLLAAEVGPVADNLYGGSGFTAYGYTHPFTAKTSLAGGAVIFALDGSGQAYSATLTASGGYGPPQFQEITMASGSSDSATAEAMITASSAIGSDPEIWLGSDQKSSYPINIFYDGVSQGRGLLGQATVTANSTTTNTTPMIVMTVNNPARKYRSGRAYMLTVMATVTSTIAGDRVKLRLTNGAVIMAHAQDGFHIPVAGLQMPVTYERIVVNPAGQPDATIYADLSIYSGSTGLVRLLAAPGNPATLTIREIGSAADYPGAMTIWG